MRAFSLVELSIVLVILGLLTGGILSGQSLIRAAELRSVISEYQRHAVAVHTFRDKYFALPGDFKDATKFWGKDGVACPADTGAVMGAGTCNGNGDGLINLAATASTTGEVFQGWKQLALAGLVEGSYTGLAGPLSTRDYDFGVNSPASKLPNAGWALGYLNNVAGGTSYAFAYDYRNSMTIGADNGEHADEPVLTPEEAWNIDNKMDDGKPAYGSIHAIFPSCTGRVNTFDFSANYAVSNKNTYCALIFRYL